MNNVLTLVRAARTSADPGEILYSDHMLAELLALHQDVIMQLRLERHELTGNAQFLTSMIEQHEATAELLCAALDHRKAETTDAGPIVITGEASSAEKRSQVTRFAQGARGTNSVRNHMTVKR